MSAAIDITPEIARERAIERKNELIGLIREEAETVRDLDKRAAEIDLQMDELRAQKKSINSDRKAVYDRLDSNGVSHTAFMTVYAEMTKMDEIERSAEGASRALCYEALDLKQGQTADFVAMLEAQQLEEPEEQD